MPIGMAVSLLIEKGIRTRRGSCSEAGRLSRSLRQAKQWLCRRFRRWQPPAGCLL